MASLADKIRPVVLLERGERLLCATFARSTAGPTVGPSVVAISDRRLFVAPKTSFLSASAWSRRRLKEVRVVSGPRSRLGVVVGRRFEMLVDGVEVAFEVEDRKGSGAVHAALTRGAGRTTP
jgi:hypothetical protein